MTLNDLEWLNGHFTLNFHYYKLALSVLLAGFETIFTYLLWSLFTLHMSAVEKCGKQSSEPWSAEYLESAEKLQIFRRRYIVGTLTNKADIII